MKKKDKYKRMKPEANASSRLTDIADGASLKKHLKMGKVSPFNGSLCELFNKLLACKKQA